MVASNPSGRDGGILNFLLVAATLGLLGTLIFATAWFYSSCAEFHIEDLSVEQRQVLMDEMLTAIPGAYAAAWFEPRIGYTLKRGQVLDLGFEVFEANELGYRSGPTDKVPGTFRVVFVGDSWTFGHGVQAHQSFPKAFEHIANQEGHSEQRIEAWTLGLSGYNTFNALAALWFFIDRLEPDAVVICPSSNDNDTTNVALANGSLMRFPGAPDEFGDSSSIKYHHIAVDSYRYRTRWRLAFQEIRETEARLQRLGIPLLHFFVAKWKVPVVHDLVQESGLESPYLINPEKYLHGSWVNPPPYGHGTAEANVVYGRIVYQGLADLLGWPRLPKGEAGSEVELIRTVPEGQAWKAGADEVLAEFTHRFIGESFRPSKAASKQCVGPMNCQTGRIGRSTTILVRRRQGARYLDIALGRIPEADSLYPLKVTVSVPSPSGEGRAAKTQTVVNKGGAEPHRFFVEMPQDVPVGTALDIVFEAERVTAARGGLTASSVLIRSIEQRESLPS
jgi:hypothetical protein